MPGAQNNIEERRDELLVELKVMKVFTKALTQYLEYVRGLKSSLGNMHSNFQQLAILNNSWVEELNESIEAWNPFEKVPENRDV